MSNSQLPKAPGRPYRHLADAKKKTRGLPVSQLLFYYCLTRAPFPCLVPLSRTSPPPIPTSSSQGRPCASSAWSCLKLPHTRRCLSRFAMLSFLCPCIAISPAARRGRFAAAQNTNLRGIVSRWDRLLIFGACNLGALACFVICIFLFPAISVASPRKLVVL